MYHGPSLFHGLKGMHRTDHLRIPESTRMEQKRRGHRQSSPLDVAVCTSVVIIADQIRDIEREHAPTKSSTVGKGTKRASSPSPLDNLKDIAEQPSPIECAEKPGLAATTIIRMSQPHSSRKPFSARIALRIIVRPFRPR